MISRKGIDNSPQSLQAVVSRGLAQLARPRASGLGSRDDRTMAAPATRDKVILAYSGGLDTSVMVKWIGEKYNLDVVAFTVDLGQGEDIQKIREKALRTGAVDAVA